MDGSRADKPQSAVDDQGKAHQQGHDGGDDRAGPHESISQDMGALLRFARAPGEVEVREAGGRGGDDGEADQCDENDVQGAVTADHDDGSSSSGECPWLLEDADDDRLPRIQAFQPSLECGRDAGARRGPMSSAPLPTGRDEERHARSQG